VKRSTLVPCTLCLLTWVTSAGLAHAQVATPGSGSRGLSPLSPDPLSNANPAALLKQLAGEVSELKFELQKLQLEIQYGKVAQLERDLQQVQASRKALETEEAALLQGIAQLDQQLSHPALAPEERRELEVSRAELGVSEVERVKNEQQTLAHREEELAKRLETARQRWQELFKRAKQLKSDVVEPRAGLERSGQAARPPR
jgi:cell division protein FtsB